MTFELILKIFTALGIVSGTSQAEIQETIDRQWLQRGTDWCYLNPVSEEKKEEIMPILQEIGCVEAIFAEKTNYDYAIVCGATVMAMKSRVAFLEKEIERGVDVGTIVFCVGKRARFVDRETDATLAGTEKCATEFELAQLVYEHSKIPREIPVIFVHGVMYPGVYRHVTTRGTLEDALISWSKMQPKAGRALFVSNQPYLLFQRELVERILPRQGISVECAGPAASPKIKLASYLTTLARWGAWKSQNSTSSDMEKPSGPSTESTPDEQISR